MEIFVGIFWFRDFLNFFFICFCWLRDFLDGWSDFLVSFSELIKISKVSRKEPKKNPTHRHHPLQSHNRKLSRLSQSDPCKTVFCAF